jgi:hypothetical protein
MIETSADENNHRTAFWGIEDTCLELFWRPLSLQQGILSHWAEATTCCLWENDYWVWKFISNSVNQYHSALFPSIILSKNIGKWGNSSHVSTLL